MHYGYGYESGNARDLASNLPDALSTHPRSSLVSRPLPHPSPPHLGAPQPAASSAPVRQPPSRGSARRGCGRSSSNGQGHSSHCLGAKLVGSAASRGRPPPPHSSDLLLGPSGGAHQQCGRLRAAAPRSFPHAGRRRSSGRHPWRDNRQVLLDCCKHMLHMFKMFIRMLQVFHVDVAKVNLDDARLHMLSQICSKCLIGLLLHFN